MTYTALLLQAVGISLAHALAVSAQNAFVLRAGLRRRHPLAAALGAALADAALIAAGVTGAGTLLGATSRIAAVAAWAGAAYLALHGLASLRAAVRPRPLEPERGAAGTPPTAVLTALAAAGFTLLSPHAYLDVLVLFGSLAAQQQAGERIAFTLAAVLTSSAWYAALALGASRLAPLLRRPGTWRLLDGVIAVVMWVVAASLVRSALAGVD